VIPAAPYYTLCHNTDTHSKHRNTYFYRDAVWTNADQSGIGLSSVKIPDQCKQENFNSPCV